MFSDLDQNNGPILPSDSQAPVALGVPLVYNPDDDPSFWEKNKRKILIGLGLLVVFGLGLFLVIKILVPTPEKNPLVIIDRNGSEVGTGEATSTETHLPTDETPAVTDEWNESLLSGALEKYNFRDFYEAPTAIPEFSLVDYSLPLNVKIDGMNYYDLSRKINLDPVIDDLNNDGFAILENPWFDRESILYSLESIALWLDEATLREFVNNYTPKQNPKRVAVICAGNIPMVGFHDMLCTLLSGNILRGSKVDVFLEDEVVKFKKTV